MTAKQIAQVRTVKQPLTYHADPLSLYEHVTHNAPHTMLLESAEIDSKDHLKSIVLTHGALMIQCDGYQLTFSALSANGQSLLAPINIFFT